MVNTKYIKRSNLDYNKKCYVQFSLVYNYYSIKLILYQFINDFMKEEFNFESYSQLKNYFNTID